jgi:t-SNARE complex subunit (syntaxin)
VSELIMASPYQQETKDHLKHIDGQLDSLVEVTNEQLDGAIRVGNELDSQIQMIGDINTHMDKTQTGIDGATGAVQQVKPGKASWISWIIAIVVVLVIILLGVFWHPTG